MRRRFWESSLSKKIEKSFSWKKWTCFYRGWKYVICCWFWIRNTLLELRLQKCAATDRQKSCSLAGSWLSLINSEFGFTLLVSKFLVFWLSRFSFRFEIMGIVWVLLTLLRITAVLDVSWYFLDVVPKKATRTACADRILLMRRFAEYLSSYGPSVSQDIGLPERFSVHRYSIFYDVNTCIFFIGLAEITSQYLPCFLRWV